MTGATVPLSLEDHPQARISLQGALAAPSHAYLFHGPPGVGKRDAALAFAAELLAAAPGSADPDEARGRALRRAHPDLTWVRPTGAGQMVKEDIEEAVVVAATRTPFEAERRVFVLERAETMNDTVANRLLKTLEEPAPFVHLILVSDSLAQVIPTVVSRCQPVRFAALSPARVEQALRDEGVDAALATPCARLALGSLGRARELATESGQALLADVDRIARAALSPSPADPEPWRPLLVRADEAKVAAEERVAEEAAARLESEPKGRDRNALQKRFETAAGREARRARTGVLELGLELASLAFRDLVCVAEGAPDAVLDAARTDARAAAAPGRDPRRLREAAERCEDTRASLELNVNEELALDALQIRLAALVG